MQNVTNKTDTLPFAGKMALLSEHLKHLLIDNRPTLVGSIHINVSFWAVLVKKRVLTDEVIENWNVSAFVFCGCTRYVK